MVGRLAAPLLGALFLWLFLGTLVENAFASKVGVDSSPPWYARASDRVAARARMVCHQAWASRLVVMKKDHPLSGWQVIVLI